MTAQQSHRPGTSPATEEAAFKKLYFKYHQKLFFYFGKQTKSDFMSEKLVQLTIINLWKQLGCLSGDLPASAQVFRIARATLVDHLQKRAVEQQQALQLRQIPADKASTGNTGHEFYLQRQINAAVDRLAPVWRNPMALEYYLPETEWGQVNRQVDHSTPSFADKIRTIDSLMKVWQMVAALPRKTGRDAG